MVVPLFFYNVLMNDQFFFDMFYPSRTGGILFLTICFFAPFSSFIRIDYPTFRHQAELDMLKMEPFTAKYAASANHQRQDDVGIFLVSCILSAVSGPFLFVYRIYRLVRPVGSAEAWGLVNKFRGGRMMQFTGGGNDGDKTECSARDG